MRIKIFPTVVGFHGREFFITAEMHAAGRRFLKDFVEN